MSAKILKISDTAKFLGKITSNYTKNSFSPQNTRRFVYKPSSKLLLIDNNYLQGSTSYASRRTNVNYCHFSIGDAFILNSSNSR